jgi:hypothetical protein
MRLLVQGHVNPSFIVNSIAVCKWHLNHISKFSKLYQWQYVLWYCQVIITESNIVGLCHTLVYFTKTIQYTIHAFTMF